MSRDYPCSLTLIEGGTIECDIEWEGDLGIAPQVAGPPDAWDPGEPAVCQIIAIRVAQNYPKLGLSEGAEIKLAQIKEDSDKLEEDILAWYADIEAATYQEPEHDDLFPEDLL